MARDTLVSWRTFALFVLFPPAALLAIVFFPVTLLVLFWLYRRGKHRELTERQNSPETRPNR
ncbi:hypothetical protein AUR64_13585 [Haloprofundus marisrubri]|uniref:Uncharacterized protein n=1 Tax=Haloprofundus marisrubri TaxID=1514971 RepID=A0A0W1R5X0_9EURY|nr:hypothetical protein [Haloprofundus marisrubri]KTG08843.1 hypothetical protein AUR64_13585 [Haloprofundus marisrubri]